MSSREEISCRVIFKESPSLSGSSTIQAYLGETWYHSLCYSAIHDRTQYPVNPSPQGENFTPSLRSGCQSLRHRERPWWSNGRAFRTQFRVQSVGMVSQMYPPKSQRLFRRAGAAASAYDKGEMCVLTLLPAKWWTLVLDSME